MNKLILLASVTFVFLIGCQYESTFEQPHARHSIEEGFGKHDSRYLRTEYIHDLSLDMCFIRQSVERGKFSKSYFANVPCTDKFLEKVR